MVAAAAVVAGALGLVRWAGSWLPQVRVAFEAVNEGKPEDDWIKAALEGMATKHLEDQGLRVRGVPKSQAAAVVKLAYQRKDAGFSIDATITKDGATTNLAPVQGSTVADATDLLLSELVKHELVIHPQRGPDPGEQERMKKIGAPSFDAFRRYQELIREIWEHVVTDDQKVDAIAAETIKRYPAWAFPYVAASIVATDAKRKELVEQARKAVPDAQGKHLLDALTYYEGGKYREALEALKQVGLETTDDVTAGYLRAEAYYDLREAEERLANLKKLHEAFRGLQFGVDLEVGYRAAAQQDKAEQVERVWLDVAPESEQARLGAVGLDVAMGKLGEASGELGHMIALFGTTGLTSMVADLQIATGHLAEADATADTLMAGSALDRAHGWLRKGQVAILQGRLPGAHQALELACDEGRPFGIQGPAQTALSELVSLSIVQGDDDETGKALGALEQYAQLNNLPDKVVKFAQELWRPRGGCPPLPVPVDDFEKRRLVRLAAETRCASCAEVVSRDLDGNENDQHSLFAFAVCAENEGNWPIAEKSFREATVVATITTSQTTVPATADAMLARAHLARVLVREGKIDEARKLYGDFLTAWEGKVTLTEVKKARDELSSLGAAKTPSPSP